jgi:hypothetical protein
MSAPRHIVDSLESVLSIYFSNCRLKERAAFILCDELVEVTCRDRVKQTVPRATVEQLNFPDLLAHPTAGLNVATPGLERSALEYHRARNDIQHNNPAATVDGQYCADANSGRCGSYRALLSGYKDSSSRQAQSDSPCYAPSIAPWGRASADTIRRRHAESCMAR